jgi:hypothetical protein
MHKRSASITLVVFSALLSPLFSCAAWAASQAPLIPRRVLFGNPERMSPQVSPNGKMLAWIAPKNGVLNVWVRGITESATSTRAVTADPKRGIRQFFWQEDSQHIVYLQDHDGDENWHLFQASIRGDGTAAWDLTPGVLQARVIARAPEFPDQLIVALNARDARFHDAYSLDLKAGQRKMVAENPGDVEYYIADHQFRVRAALARLPDSGAEVRVRDDEQSPWRKLTGWGPDDVDGELLAFSTDDREVLYTSSARADIGQLLATDVRSGETRLIAEDKQKQFDAGKILVHPATHALEAVQFRRERNSWEPFGTALGADFVLGALPAAVGAARRTA